MVTNRPFLAASRQVMRSAGGTVQNRRFRRFDVGAVAGRYQSCGGIGNVTCATDSVSSITVRLSSCTSSGSAGRNRSV